MTTQSQDITGERCQPGTTRTTDSRRSGCATSSPQDTSRRERLTSEVSPMSGPTICVDTRNVTSSPGLEDGRLRSAGPASRTTLRCGAQAVPAPPGHGRASGTEAEPERTIRVTSGRHSSNSSKPAVQTSSMESRSPAARPDSGSTVAEATLPASATDFFTTRAGPQITAARRGGKGSSRLYACSVSYVETKQNGCLPYTNIFYGGSPV